MIDSSRSAKSAVRSLRANDRFEPATDPSRLFDALRDADCQCIVTEARDKAKSANELAAACDVPTSTLYRKLELLTEVGLLRERIRIVNLGQYPSEYVCPVNSVRITIDEEIEISLQITDRDEYR